MCSRWTTLASFRASPRTISRAIRSAGPTPGRSPLPGTPIAASPLGIFGGRSIRCPWPTDPDRRARHIRGAKALAKRTFLDFEQPIAELETKIEELRYVQTESAVDISEEIDQLGKKSQQLTKDIYSQ